MAMDGSSAVPQDVIKCLHTITSRFERVESNLRDVLKACDPDVMAEMPPLDRAYAFLTLANAVAALYSCEYLRTKILSTSLHLIFIYSLVGPQQLIMNSCY